MIFIMEWIYEYQLYLFDLDGLLVNTEELHFQAYKDMLSARGFTLPWDFHRYCCTAHYHSDTIAQELYELFPALHAQEPRWEVLYSEKKQAMTEQLRSGLVEMMPGAKELLGQLQSAQIPHCVVTHSPSDLVALLRQQHPILDGIPYWIARHDYSRPKPASDCYLKAIADYAQPGDNIIGFEDSPRGLRALMGTQAQAVLIAQVTYPEIPEFVLQGASHYHSLDEFINSQKECVDTIQSSRQ